MFGIGFFELVIIAVVALILVGPKKLPEMARQFGRFFVQIRRMTNDVKSTIETPIHDAELDIVKEEREKFKKLLGDTQQKAHAEIEQAVSDIKADLPGTESHSSSKLSEI